MTAELDCQVPEVQASMFVDVDEVLEDGERVSLRVRSVVRLHHLYQCHHFRRYGSQFLGVEGLIEVATGNPQSLCSLLVNFLAAERRALVAVAKTANSRAAARLVRTSPTIQARRIGGASRTSK